jgi:serine/threonine-protein kinase
MTGIAADPDNGDADDPVLPRAFGGYTLVALLGRGGMGEVYLAMRGGIEGISRRCVVKTLRPGFGDDREYVARFLDEARIVVQLLHRNICPVFDVGKIDGRYFLAMEYIAGRDLRTVADRLAQAGRGIDMRRVSADGIGLASHIVCEVLEALEHAHTLSDPATGDPLHLVHRDVSPHNVMVGYDGDVRLIDFGLAASTLKVEHTAPNVVMGKVGYMAPEHICGDPLDASADQFSAAVLAVELFTGQRFYEGMSNRDIYAAAATGGYRPPTMAMLPPALAAICNRALQAERRARYPSCGAFRAALDSWRYDVGLRGDGTVLRGVMRDVFADDIAHDRAILKAAAVTAGLPSDGLLTVPGPIPPRPQDTLKNPRIQSTPSERTPTVDDAGLTVSAPSAPLVLQPPPPAPRRAAPIAAVLGTVAVLAIGGFVVSKSSTSSASSTSSTSLTAPATTTTVTATETATPATAATETAATETAVAAATETAAATPTVDVVAASAHDAVVPKKRPPKPTATSTKPTPAPAPAPPKPTTKPTTKPRTEKRPAATAPLTVQLRWILATCPAAPCAKAIAGQKDTWGSLAPAALQSYRGQVNQCLDDC